MKLLTHKFLNEKKIIIFNQSIILEELLNLEKLIKTNLNKNKKLIELISSIVNNAPLYCGPISYNVPFDKIALDVYEYEEDIKRLFVIKQEKFNLKNLSDNSVDNIFSDLKHEKHVLNEDNTLNSNYDPNKALVFEALNNHEQKQVNRYIKTVYENMRKKRDIYDSRYKTKELIINKLLPCFLIFKEQNLLNKNFNIKLQGYPMPKSNKIKYFLEFNFSMSKKLSVIEKLLAIPAKTIMLPFKVFDKLTKFLIFKNIQKSKIFEITVNSESYKKLSNQLKHIKDFEKFIFFKPTPNLFQIMIIWMRIFIYLWTMRSFQLLKLPKTLNAFQASTLYFILYLCVFLLAYELFRMLKLFNIYLFTIKRKRSENLII
jgi:hypothetical protein